MEENPKIVPGLMYTYNDIFEPKIIVNIVGSKCFIYNTLRCIIFECPVRNIIDGILTGGLLVLDEGNNNENV
jgi:hypothetical protein